MHTVDIIKLNRKIAQTVNHTCKNVAKWRTKVVGSAHPELTKCRYMLKWKARRLNALLKQAAK